MRAKEFIPETSGNLGNALKAIIAQRSQAAAAAKSTNPNAVKTGAAGQGTIGSSIPATTGGAQAPNSAATQMGKTPNPQIGTQPGKQIGQPVGTQLGKTTPAAVAATDVDAALSPGKMIDIPGLGKAKLGKQTAQGIEIDTSQVPGIGLPKIIINPKDLMR
jgi:hypothetical protein